MSDAQWLMGDSINEGMAGFVDSRFRMKSHRGRVSHTYSLVFWEHTLSVVGNHPPQEHTDIGLDVLHQQLLTMQGANARLTRHQYGAYGWHARVVPACMHLYALHEQCFASARLQKEFHGQQVFVMRNSHLVPIHVH